MDIEKIKQQSIVETLEKFKPYEDAINLKGFNMADEKQLIDFLDTKAIDYNDLINYHNRYCKESTERGRRMLVKELEKLEKLKRSFQFQDASIHNEINQSQNKAVITDIMRDYCFYAFVYNATDSYFNEVTQSDGQILKKSETKFPEKFYSFYHLMLIFDLHTEKEFEINNDDHKRGEIESYGKSNYGTGQVFYREYLHISGIMHKKSDVAKYLGRGYKAKIIKISGNDSRIIEKLKDYPN